MSKCSWNLYRSGGRQTVNKYVEFLRFKETNKAGEEFRKGGPERLHLEGNRALKEVREQVSQVSGCYGLNCVPPQIHMFKSLPPVPPNVNLFGEKPFKEEIKLKWGW